MEPPEKVKGTMTPGGVTMPRGVEVDITGNPVSWCCLFMKASYLPFSPGRARERKIGFPQGTHPNAFRKTPHQGAGLESG
jgi:hypothetical protein